MKKSLDGKEIKQIRRELKMTAVAFSGLIGITPPYLSELEHDKKQASQQLINLILSKKTDPADMSAAVMMGIQNQLAMLNSRFDGLNEFTQSIEKRMKRMEDILLDYERTGDRAVLKKLTGNG